MGTETPRRPSRFMRLWRFGMKVHRNLVGALARHRGATRLLCAAEACPGLRSALSETKSPANVRSCTDAFSYKALSFTIVEHSPFNPRNLPTTGLSAGRLWPIG